MTTKKDQNEDVTNPRIKEKTSNLKETPSQIELLGGPAGDYTVFKNEPNRYLVRSVFIMNDNTTNDSSENDELYGTVDDSYLEQLNMVRRNLNMLELDDEEILHVKGYDDKYESTCKIREITSADPFSSITPNEDNKSSTSEDSHNSHNANKSRTITPKETTGNKNIKLEGSSEMFRAQTSVRSKKSIFTLPNIHGSKKHLSASKCELKEPRKSKEIIGTLPTVSTQVVDNKTLKTIWKSSKLNSETSLKSDYVANDFGANLSGSTATSSDDGTHRKESSKLISSPDLTQLAYKPPSKKQCVRSRTPTINSEIVRFHKQGQCCRSTQCEMSSKSTSGASSDRQSIDLTSISSGGIQAKVRAFFQQAHHETFGGEGDTQHIVPNVIVKNDSKNSSNNSSSKSSKVVKFLPPKEIGDFNKERGDKVVSLCGDTPNEILYEFDLKEFPEKEQVVCNVTEVCHHHHQHEKCRHGLHSEITSSDISGIAGNSSLAILGQFSPRLMLEQPISRLAKGKSPRTMPHLQEDDNEAPVNFNHYSTNTGLTVPVHNTHSYKFPAISKLSNTLIQGDFQQIPYPEEVDFEDVLEPPKRPEQKSEKRKLVTASHEYSSYKRTAKELIDLSALEKESDKRQTENPKRNQKLEMNFYNIRSGDESPDAAKGDNDGHVCNHPVHKEYRRSTYREPDPEDSDEDCLTTFENCFCMRKLFKRQRHGQGYFQ